MSTARAVLLTAVLICAVEGTFYQSPCQPTYYQPPCRCQRYYTGCGGQGSRPTAVGTGYYQPVEGFGNGGGVTRWGEYGGRIPHHPRKFEFIWSDEEEEPVRPRGKTVTKTTIVQEKKEFVIPPTITRKKTTTTKKTEDLLDGRALLELNSSEIEKGRKSNKKDEEEDLWTDSETPSKGIVKTTRLTSSDTSVASSGGSVDSSGTGGMMKGEDEDDLWKDSPKNSTDWRSTGVGAGYGTKMSIVGMDGGSGAGVGVGGQAGENYRGWTSGAGYGTTSGAGSGTRAMGSLFGLSSGFGVTAPGVGNIGGGWGFGIG